MKLERFEVLGVRVKHRGDWLFVRLVSDTGHVGLGEVSHSSDDRAVSQQLATRVAPFLRGRELAAVGPLLRELQVELGSNSGAARIVATALSGTEHALWDVCRILAIARADLPHEGRALLMRVVSMLTRMCR